MRPSRRWDASVGDIRYAYRLRQLSTPPAPFSLCLFCRRASKKASTGSESNAHVTYSTCRTVIYPPRTNTRSLALPGVAHRIGVNLCTSHREGDLWDRYAVGRYNTSPQSSSKILAAIDPALVQDFNNTLSHQWQVYSHAVYLYKHR